MSRQCNASFSAEELQKRMEDANVNGAKSLKHKTEVTQLMEPAAKQVKLYDIQRQKGSEFPLFGDKICLLQTALRMSLVNISWTIKYVLYPSNGKSDVLLEFNDNFITTDTCGRNVKQLDLRNMFSNIDNKIKRLLIVGKAGLGKTTIVHQIYKQWLDGDPILVETFPLVINVKIDELSNDDVKDVNSVCESALDNEYKSLVKELFDPQSAHYATVMSQTLFLIDGIDECKLELGHDVQLLIRGERFCEYQPFVVLTTSEPNKFKNSISNTLHVKLVGYNEYGIKQKLMDFKVKTFLLSQSTLDVLKTPLFLELYCSLYYHGIGIREPITNCSLVEQYVKMLGVLYRKDENEKNKQRNFSFYKSMMAAFGFDGGEHFSFEKELTLISTLGSYSQNRYKLLDGDGVKQLVLTSENLILAKTIKYVTKINISTENKICSFLHPSIYTYYAAFYWNANSGLRVSHIEYGILDEVVVFSDPYMYKCSTNCSTSQFLAYFNNNYKLFLWTHWQKYVPYFDNYSNLPTIFLKCPEISFPTGSIYKDISQIMDKIRLDFDLDRNFKLEQVKFSADKIYSILLKCRSLTFYSCEFYFGPDVFFQYYNVSNLTLSSCTWLDESLETNDSQMPDANGIIYKTSHSNCSALRHLSLVLPCTPVNDFMIYVSRRCKNLVSIQFKMLRAEDYDWTHNLNIDSDCFPSLETLEINDSRHDLIIDKMQAVKTLKHLKIVKPTIPDGESKEIWHQKLLSDISQLKNLTSLELDNVCMATNTLNHLISNVFTNFNDEFKCVLVAEPSVGNESVLDNLNLSSKMYEIILDCCGLLKGFAQAKLFNFQLLSSLDQRFIFHKT